MSDLLGILSAPALLLILMGFGVLFRSAPARISGWLPLCAAGIFMIPYVVACGFTFPSLDDWSYGASGRDAWWSAQENWYRGWSGRILVTALLSGWGNIGSPWFAAAISYRLLIIGVFAFTCWAVWYVIGAVLAKVENFDRRQHGCLTLVTIAGAITLLPDPGEGLYWLPGAASYTIGTALALFACGHLLHATRAARSHLPSAIWPPPYHWGFSTLTLIAACFSSEVVAALALSAIAGLIMFHLRGRQRWHGGLVLIGGLLATTISLASPGNAIRAANAIAEGQIPVDHHPGVMVTATFSLMSGFLRDLPWAPLAALGAWIAHTSPRTQTKTGLLLIATIPVFVVVAAVPMAWAGMTPPRAWNPLAMTTALALILGAWHGGPRLVPVLLLLTGLSLLSLASDNDRMLILAGGWAVLGIVAWVLRRRLPPRLLIACLAAALLLGSERFTQAVIDVGRGPDYVRQQQARLAVLASAPPQSALIVPALTGDLPYLYHINDLQFSETTWQNQGCARFFNLRSVRTVIEPQAQK